MARSRRRGPYVEFRVLIFCVIILAAFGGLIARLWWVQVARGAVYTAKISGRSQITVRIPSVRGEIRDRNGIPLVTNRASYEVDFYLRAMVDGYRARAHERGEPMPQIRYEAPVKGMLTKKTEADIVKIVNTAVVPRLEDLDLAKDYNAKKLKTHFRNDTEVPFTYLEDIDFKTIAKFSEHDVGLPGVDISIRPVRQYLYGALAAHLLGYVGLPNDISLEPDVKDYNFYQPDYEGKNQIEQTYDKLLRGKPGVRVMQRNVKGMIEGEVSTQPPVPGANVYLTLDARIQYITELALRAPQLGRAAAVVLDPNNGDILAMASIPSFDPNIFIPSVSAKDWDQLNTDPAVPLVNRAVSGFPPGSTFKIITALAGLKKKIGGHYYNCSGGVQIGDRYFKCWIAEKGRGHGLLGLADAIKVSCDSFFYQYGIDAGIDALAHIGQVLGLGQKYDLGLADEKEGIMPSPEWMKLKYPREKWSNAQTANTSIGQGYVLASPLQMAEAYATVANGGVAYSPRLVKTVLDADGKPALDDKGQVAVPDQPKVREDLRTEVSPAQIEIVRQGLWKVVNEKGGTGGGGTGAKGQVKGVVVAGKTGTAQATERGKKEHIAWFCCFAPFDHPKYVVVAMVQGGEHGGGVAAPIAAHILDQCLALDQGTFKVDLQPLAPAHSDHPFAMIEALNDYKDTAPVLNAEADDESNNDQGSTGQNPQMGGGKAKPDIRPEADEAGKVIPRAQRVKQPKEQAQPTPVQDRRSIFQRFLHPNQLNAPPPTGDKPRAH